MPPAKVFAPLHSMPPAQGEPHKYYSTVRLCLASGLWTKSKGQENAMERFLRAFASDQLQVIEVTETRSPKRQKLIDESYKLHNELEEKLNSEEKEMLERLLDINADEHTLYAEDKFIRGYRLGVLMTMEVFAGQEKFFYDGRTE